MLELLIQHSPFHLTQSIWSGEAFSILLSVNLVIYKIIFETSLYYILLHFWMKVSGSEK